MNVLDEPRPVLAGTSARLWSSRPLSRSCRLERRAEDAVLDLVDRVDDLALGVREADGVVEAPGDADEDELVDRGGDEEAAVLARVARQVGAPAA